MQVFILKRHCSLSWSSLLYRMKEIDLTSGVCNVAYGCELSPMNKIGICFYYSGDVYDDVADNNRMNDRKR